MATDKANIFNLDEILFEEYRKTPFYDCMPGAEEFAECLKCSILTKPTPYVLLLEDRFGMGKTHFSTRFASFLRESMIDAVYFSAWENDYMKNPFISFSAEILKYFQKSKTAQKDKFVETTKTICRLIVNITKSTTLSAGINLFGNQIESSFDMDKAVSAVEDFIGNFTQKDDFLINFKKTLKSFIKELPNHKLVIIVDELDRCRPDYAMKTLEIIKHFFDIEGLFIIVPTNERSLQKSVKALYGIDDENEKESLYESYINKFFNEKLSLFKPDYLNLTKNLITTESVKHLIGNGQMVLTEKYNSLEVLQNKIAQFAENYKLSIREVKKVCDKAVYICSYTDKNIYCEYIAYRLCSQEARTTNNNCRVADENPFSTSIRSKKAELLKFTVPPEVYTTGGYNYRQDFSNEFEIFRDRQMESYKEFDDFYQYFKSKMPCFDDFRGINDRFLRQIPSFNFTALQEYIEQKKNEIDEYRTNWNSSDKDEAIMSYYNNIIEKEPYIHAEKLKIKNKV